jgi:hypothetical protein
MKKLIYFYFILQYCLGYSQNNLIPNYSFEETMPGHNIASCGGNDISAFVQYEDSDIGESNFNDDIANWNYAWHHDSHRKMPKWIDYHTCSLDAAIDCNCVPMISVFPSNRFIVIEVEYKNYTNCDPHKYAAIRNGLNPQTALTTGITYTLRYKYIPFKIHSSCESNILNCSSNANLSVYLTNYAYYWDSNDDENQKIEIDNLSEVGPFNDCNWKLREKDIILDSDHDNLLNIVLVCNEQGFMIDDVELFEKCPTEKIIQNKFYFGSLYPNSDYMESAENNLYAGCCINQNQNFGDVLIESGSSVKFTAGEQISLLPGFHAVSGSDFSGRIVPCESNKGQTIESISYHQTINSQISQEILKIKGQKEIEALNSNKTDKNMIAVSPNPANNVLFIDGLAFPALVSVFDMSGNKILSFNLNENRIDITDLAQGLYFIKFFTPEGNIVRKFVKE